MIQIQGQYFSTGKNAFKYSEVCRRKGVYAAKSSQKGVGVQILRSNVQEEQLIPGQQIKVFG